MSSNKRNADVAGLGDSSTSNVIVLDSSDEEGDSTLAISVYVESTGETLEFQVQPSDTIGQLKQQIHVKVKLPVDQLELTYLRPLEDDRRISSLKHLSVNLKRKEFQVHVLEISNGKKHSLMVNGTDTVLNFMYQVKGRTEVPLGDMRLYFERGRLCGEHSTLDECLVLPESKISLMLPQVGMISTFTSKNEKDPLTQYLLLSDQERAQASIPIEKLRQKATDEGASLESFHFDKECIILNTKKIQWLNRFLDFLWLESLGSVNHSDLRVRVSDECFIALMAPLDDDASAGTLVLQNLKARSKATEPYIALRMTTGPTNACIGFHCDGPCATYTTQIALNDPSEYDGGRLCFFVNDQLHVLERPTGSIVEHPSQVLHGVTALTRGTRRSLFVVDIMNGLGEGGVVEVKMAHVERFIKQN